MRDLDGARLTKAQRRALEWIREREPVGAFSADGPRLAMVSKLEGAGLIERAGREPGRFGFIEYALTSAGRAALESSDEQ